MALRRAREASRAGELPLPSDAGAAETLAGRDAADLGLLPEALLGTFKPALPVVDMARRLARDASRAEELVVFAVCAMVLPRRVDVCLRTRTQPRPSNTTNANP